MVSELERGEDFKTSPLFSQEIGQYHVQTVNFRASKKFLSIAEIGCLKHEESGDESTGIIL